MTRHVTPAAGDVHRRGRQQARRRRVRRGRAAGAAAARRRPDPPCLAQDRRADRAARPRRLRGRSARPRRFRMGRRTAPTRSRISPPTRGRWPTRWPSAAACGRSRSAPRSAASRRCWRKAAERQRRSVFSALVLVDITPRVDLDGVAKVQGFMRAHAKEGFASIAEAADAVAAYLPHRPRPRSQRRAEEEPAAASRRPLALALGPALPRRPPPGRAGRRARSSAMLVEAAQAASKCRRCWCAARPRNWCRRSTPRTSSNSCRMPPMSTSAAPATWWPATATISSQTPSRSFLSSLR